MEKTGGFIQSRKLNKRWISVKCEKIKKSGKR